MKINHKNYLIILLTLFAIEWIYLAIKPLYPHNWMLENVLMVIAIIYIITTFEKFPLSRISYTLIFIFLGLHSIGTHFTKEWSESLSVKHKQPLGEDCANA